MKFLLLSLLFISISVHSQDEQYYEVIYRSSSMTFNTYKQPKEAFMSLYVYGDNTIYQWNNERKLDSIRTKREITNVDLGRHFSRERYAIEIEKNKLKFYNVISDVEYQYEEEISFDWKLESKTKSIKGFECKKATTSYGGRDWIAWYAIDIPINAGPYKFKDLPGLILKITDKTNSYDFEVHSIQTKAYLPLKKLYHHSKENKRVKVNRIEHNKIRFEYNGLTLKDRMALLNKTNGVTNEVVITSKDGTNPLSEERNVDRSKKNNFIEIDHN